MLFSFKILSRLVFILLTSLGVLVVLRVFHGFQGDHPNPHLLLCSPFFLLPSILRAEAFFFLTFLFELASVFLEDVFQ